MRCRFCESDMMSQSKDNVGRNLYGEIYVCLNKSCQAVYEEYTDIKGNELTEKNKWYNPIDQKAL